MPDNRTNNNPRPTSRSSTGSVASKGSVGIAASGLPEIPMSISEVKLRPVGTLPTAPIYDAVVFFIYCEEHDKFAMNEVIDGTATATAGSKLYYFPFVARESRSWNKTADEGLAILFERRDADGTVVSAFDLADYERCYLQMDRVQAAVDTSEWAERMVQFVSIKKCKLKCEPVNTLVWLRAVDLRAHCDDSFWGHEYRFFYDKFKKVRSQHQQMEVVEHKIDPVLYHIIKCDRQPGEIEGSADETAKMFQSAKLETEALCDLYEDYQQHCFPAYQMNLGNFRVYMRKLGFTGSAFGCKCRGKDGKQSTDGDEDALLRTLFQACFNRLERPHPRVPYLNFFDISFVVVAMDPRTPTEDARARFLFTYYDADRDNHLTGAELKALLEDTGASAAKLPAKLSMRDFEKALKDGKLPKADKLCRLPKSVFDLLEARKAKIASEQSGRSSKGSNKPRKPLRVRGTCPKCTAKNMHIGQHCVTIDTEGRCVEPQVIVERDASSTALDERLELYSMEFQFNPSSLGNVFFDYIRNRKFALDSATADPKSQRYIYEQLKVLCEHVAALVKHEPKVIKRQSPAALIGEMRGSLEDLLVRERQLWHTLPIVAENLIFLGNYSGACGYGKKTQAIESLIYMLAIKYLCPNKVVLLRGIQETRSYNIKTLLPECVARCGEELGKEVWNAFNSVFERLPYFAIINESIVCASSGFPKEATKQPLARLFQNLPPDSGTGNKECAMLQQILTNVPNRKEADPRGAINFKPRPQQPNAFLFSAAAYHKFLSQNKFHYMVRSNELLADGYDVCFSRSLITIQSHRLEDTKATFATVSADGIIQMTECVDKSPDEAQAQQGHA